MSKAQRYPLRVMKGGYAPADTSAASVLRTKHKIGDLVFVEFKKPRNPGFHRLAHALGSLLVENLEPFEALTSHECLKRLQIETGLGCDEISIMFPGIGPTTYRVPRSISYESMAQDEFHNMIEGFCKYVSKTYWPTCEPEEIERMAELWIGENG